MKNKIYQILKDLNQKFLGENANQNLVNNKALIEKIHDIFEFDYFNMSFKQFEKAVNEFLQNGKTDHKKLFYTKAQFRPNLNELLVLSDKEGTEKLVIRFNKEDITVFAHKTNKKNKNGLIQTDMKKYIYAENKNQLYIFNEEEFPAHKPFTMNELFELSEMKNKFLEIFNENDIDKIINSLEENGEYSNINGDAIFEKDEETYLINFAKHNNLNHIYSLKADCEKIIKIEHFVNLTKEPFENQEHSNHKEEQINQDLDQTREDQKINNTSENQVEESNQNEDQVNNEDLQSNEMQSNDSEAKEAPENSQPSPSDNQN